MLSQLVAEGPRLLPDEYIFFVYRSTRFWRWRRRLRFAASFRYFVANYSFPAFEFGSLMFFANTGVDTFWELGTRLFQDQHMSPQLLKAGFLQIGNPFFYNYDPVCFDCNSPRIEKRIVQLDHEAILQQGQLTIVKEIAPSFVDVLHAAGR
jgi:hypothetical protein